MKNDETTALQPAMGTPVSSLARGRWSAGDYILAAYVRRPDGVTVRRYVERLPGSAVTLTRWQSAARRMGRIEARDAADDVRRLRFTTPLASVRVVRLVQKGERANDGMTLAVMGGAR